MKPKKVKVLVELQGELTETKTDYILTFNEVLSFKNPTVKPLNQKDMDLINIITETKGRKIKVS